jgi:SAM-dependent methyltransferase
MILDRWMWPTPTGSTTCEVGAGKSLVAELRIKHGRSLKQLLITDQSSKMLEYSRQFEVAGATLRVATAGDLPLPSDSIEWLVASLGDPYNTETFWTETVRVLKRGGKAVFTTPAYDWAKCFRDVNDNDAGFKEAEFELIDGRRVRLPSFIYSEENQVDLVEKHGLIVNEVCHVTIADLKAEPLSPKLCLQRGPAGSVVSGFLITKPRS